MRETPFLFARTKKQKKLAYLKKGPDISRSFFDEQRSHPISNREVGFRIGIADKVAGFGIADHVAGFGIAHRVED